MNVRKLTYCLDNLKENNEKIIKLRKRFENSTKVFELELTLNSDKTSLNAQLEWIKTDLNALKECENNRDKLIELIEKELI